MRYSVGDVVWYLPSSCKAHIEEVGADYYKIAYLRPSAGMVRTRVVSVDDLSDYLLLCPVCTASVRVLSGKIVAHQHGKAGVANGEAGKPYCYGSFLPQR